MEYLEKKDFTKACILWLFPLFSVLTICSSLRFYSLPFGIGELGIILLLLFFVVSKFNVLVKVLTNYYYLLLFFIAYLSVLLLASLVSYHKNIINIGWKHDILAISFSGVYSFLTLLVLVYLGDYKELIKRFVLYVFFLGVLSLIVNVFQKIGYYQLSIALNMNTWYEGVRVSGWSSDPNQWAFMFLIALFFMLRMDFIYNVKNKVSYFYLAIFFWFCLSPRSDAVLVSTFMLLLFFLFLSVFNGVKFDTKKNILALSMFIIVFAVFKYNLFGRLYDAVANAILLSQSQVHLDSIQAKTLSNPSQMILGIGVGGDKIEVRLNLITHALQAWLTSPIIGLGAGAYSGIEAPFQGQEAHNLVVQLLVNSGLIGLLLALTLFFWLFISLRKDYQGQLMILGVVILVFHGGAQYMMRHPLFWMVFSVAVWEAKNRQFEVHKQ